MRAPGVTLTWDWVPEVLFEPAYKTAHRREDLASVPYAIWCDSGELVAHFIPRHVGQ